MKRLLAYLFMLLCFGMLISVKADDINDFEVEGLSIGDSLLKIYSQKYIEKKKSDLKFGKKKINEYQKIYKKKNNDTYDVVILYFKSKDSSYSIKQIKARKFFKNKIDECFRQQEIIVEDLEKTLLTSEKLETGIVKHKSYPNGDSYLKDVTFYTSKNSKMHITCYDFSKKDTRSKDRLSVVLKSGEYSNWLEYKD